MSPRAGSISTLLVAGLLLAACGREDSKAVKADAIRTGDALMAEKKHAPAAAAYGRAVGVDPNDGALRLKLARAHEGAGQWTAAANEAMRAADLLPGDFDARFLASRLILGQSRFEDSLAITTALLSERPTDPDLLVLWGTAAAKLINSTWALFKLGPTGGRGPKYDEGCTTIRPLVSPEHDREAEAALRAAVARAPDSFDAALALINYLWAARRADESADLLQRTADRAPHGLANEVAGYFFLARGQYPLAEKYLEVAAEASASYTRAPRLALADHYLARGRFEDALRHLTLMPASDDEGGVIAVRKVDAEVGLGRYANAAQQLDAILAKYPKQRRGLALKSTVLLKTGKTAEAVVAAREAVAADLAFAEARVALGAALLADGDTTGAFAEYTEARRLDPSRRELIPLLARLALDTSRNRQAQMFARQALGLFPNDRDARIVLVSAQVRLRDYESAAATLAPLLLVQPRPVDVHVQLGLLEAGRGNEAAARAAFEAALTVNPASIDAMSALVTFDLNSGRLTEAHERVTRAMAARPSDVAVLSLASQVFRAVNDPRRAEQVLRTALALEPDDAGVTVLLANCLSDTGRASEARELLERTLLRQPGAIEVRTALGSALEWLGRPDDARTQYERVLATRPGEAAATARLALLSVAQGRQLDRVLGLLKEAEPDFARYADIKDALGWVYLHLGTPARAVRELEEAVRANPRHAGYQYHVGVAYARMGQTAKARAALSEALALESAFVDRGNAEAALKALPR